MTSSPGQKVPRKAICGHGPEVSALALGSWHTWDRMDFDAGVDLLRHALDVGINLFDVGHYNMGPHQEGSRSDILFGKIVEATGVARTDYVLSEKLWLWNYPDEPLRDQLDRSLSRVGVDHADLVVVGDFVGEMDMPRLVTDIAELIRSGRCAQWGFNNWAAEDARAAYDFARREGLPTPRMAQLKYSLCRRSVPEGEPYRRIFDELGVSLQASDIFEGGLLAGSPRGGRRVGGDTGGIRDRIQQAAPELAAIAGGLDATPAQLAVGFCLTHPATNNVLFGASTMNQLVDNLGAIDLVARHGDEIRQRVRDYWLDKGIVEPTAAWSTTREQSLNPPTGDHK